MTEIPTLFIHSSEIYFEGMRAILSGSRFALEWRSCLDETVEHTAREARESASKQLLIIIGELDRKELGPRVRNLREACPHSRIVLLGSSFTSADVALALHCGADGHLGASLRRHDIAPALETVMSGAVVLTEDFVRNILDLHVHEPQTAAVESPPKALPDSRPVVETESDSADYADRSIAPSFETVWPAADAPAPAAATPEFVGAVRPGVSKQDALVRAASLARALGSEPSPGFAAPAQRPMQGLLSLREVEILRCLVKGESNKEIARTLDLAETTVKVHLKAITRKICVRNRTQAAIWAYDHLGLRDVFDDDDDDDAPLRTAAE